MAREASFFEKNIRALYGDGGSLWLAGLSKLTEYYAQKWSLSDLRPFENLSYAYVLSGKRYECPIVMKISIASLNREALALDVFKGRGCVEILEREEKTLLLQGLLPGNPLTDLFPHEDMRSRAIVFELIKKLHATPLPRIGLFPRVHDWLKVLDQSWAVPLPFLEKARRLRDFLLERDVPQVLLHADLHHGNILQKGNTWRAIDPMGAMGDPLYEVAAFIRNPLVELAGYKDRQALIEARILSFASLFQADPSVIAQWCFVQSVLGWVWCLQDATPATSFEVLTPLFDLLSQQTQQG